MYNYLEKIDKSIYSMVSTQENKPLECIVYANDYFSFRKNLIKSGKTFKEFPFISAFGMELFTKDVFGLAKSKVVTYIAKNAKVTAQSFVSKKVMHVDSFYKRNFDGKGATIAVIDTGIYPHLDFVMPVNRIVKFVDLINNRKFPYDDNGHGTMVTSLACGNGLVYMGKYSGISPRSNIVAIKAMESSGESGTTKILEAMQWVYDNHVKYNIKVVCMSFGSTPIDNNDPLAKGAESLWNIGICVVAAAGNSGPENETIKSPGISNRIMTVGGLDDKRQGEEYFEKEFEVAEFSSRGPVRDIYKPDLIAPAVNIVGASNKGGYTIMSGTSVATPFVAGTALLLMAKYPRLTPDQVKVRLVKSCKKLTPNQNEDGFGVLDCDRLFI